MRPSPRPSRSRKRAADSTTAIRPIARTETRGARRGRRPGRRCRRDVADRRAAVRAIGDGRLRGVAADTAGATRATSRCGCASLERIYTGQMPSRHDHAAAPARRSRPARRCPDGADAVVMVEETAARQPATDERSTSFAPAARRAEHRPPRRRHHPRRPAWCAAGDLLTPEPRSARWRPSAAPTSTCTRGRASRFCRPATRSIDPGQPLAPGQIYDVNRFTLGAIVARARRRRRSAHRPAQDTRRRADGGARRAAPTPTSSSSPAAARSASAI